MRRGIATCMRDKPVFEVFELEFEPFELTRWLVHTKGRPTMRGVKTDLRDDRGSGQSLAGCHSSFNARRA